MHPNHLKQFLKATTLLLATLLVVACIRNHPPRYAVSADNFEQLKTYAGTQAQVASLSQSAKFNSLCRLGSFVGPADGLTIAELITKAFNDEFKLAGIYSENGIKIIGDVTNVEFSSGVFLDGYWNISLNLESSNGKAMPVSHRYSFTSNYIGDVACDAVAAALIPAVQDLIKKAVFHPQFGGLLEQQEER